MTYIAFAVVVFAAGVAFLLRRRQLERRQAQTAIAESRDLLLTVIDNAPARVFWKDLNLRYLGCNVAYARDAGLKHPKELVGKDDYQMGWATQADAYRAADQAVMDSGVARLSYEEPQTAPGGQTRWLRTSKVPLRNRSGKIIGLLGIYEDITEHRHADERLQQLSIAVEQSPASVVITDLDARIQYVNPRFTEVTGYSADEAIGQNPRILQSTLTAAEIYTDMWSRLTSGVPWHGELINRRKDGAIYWEDSQIAPVKNLAGAITHYVAIKTDITERKKLEDQVQQLAFQDALTGLPNRRLLTDRLTQAMNASKRNNRYGALLFLDLDNFKPLNDRHGHAVGDQLLLEVADRLKNCVREIDTVSRFGGDEFVVLLSDLDSDQEESTQQADIVAEKIRIALQEPYALAVKHAHGPDSMVSHRCTASIGVGIFINHTVGQDDMLARADAAMYQAKDAGRNCIRFFDSGT
jgi:diguanylate cyclase (GGDEF)-like protein/PAS domain S-box-containing protein